MTIGILYAIVAFEIDEDGDQGRATSQAAMLASVLKTDDRVFVTLQNRALIPERHITSYEAVTRWAEQRREPLLETFGGVTVVLTDGMYNEMLPVTEFQARVASTSTLASWSSVETSVEDIPYEEVPVDPVTAFINGSFSARFLEAGVEYAAENLFMTGGSVTPVEFDWTGKRVRFELLDEDVDFNGAPKPVIEGIVCDERGRHGFFWVPFDELV